MCVFSKFSLNVFYLGDEEREDEVEELELGPVTGSFLFLDFLTASEDVEDEDEAEDGGFVSSSWPLELVLLERLIFILKLGEAGAIGTISPEAASKPVSWSTMADEAVVVVVGGLLLLEEM